MSVFFGVLSWGCILAALFVSRRDYDRITGQDATWICFIGALTFCVIAILFLEH